MKSEDSGAEQLAMIVMLLMHRMGIKYIGFNSDDMETMRTLHPRESLIVEGCASDVEIFIMDEEAAAVYMEDIKEARHNLQ